MNRRLAAAVVLVLAAASAAVPVTASEPVVSVGFTDVAGDRFFSEPIAWARADGVVDGYSVHCFGPELTATRAEVIAVIHRALGEPGSAGVYPFTDVVAGWQQAPVAWAFEQEITTGTSPTTFDPSAPATRAEIGAFLWRASGRPDAPPSVFVDVVRDWQIAPIGWLAAEGITTGRSPTAFDPDTPVTRAELVTFLWRWRGSPAATTTAPADPLHNCDVDLGVCSDLFGDAFVASLPTDVIVTAAVHDHRTGCWYHLDEGRVVTTASVIKAQVLAGVLLDAQEAGRDLTATEAANVELMMHYSHNRPPTSELYLQVGSAAGMEALDARFAVPGTSHTPRYGATLSTAADRTILVDALLVGGGPLDDASRAAAWEWMSGVSDAQSWGVSAGLPADHEFALKNGFYPMSGRGWRLGTTGAVRDRDGGVYAMTVMTEQNATEAEGIALVERVAAHVNERLTTGERVMQRSETVTCIEPVGGTSWETAAASIGEVDAATLRLLNGGEASVLSGQRICRP
ncbi:MAG: S-layer homology domain-containing protein [Actinomycetota bacterium]